MPAPTSATVGTSSATAANANSARRSIILRNISTGNKVISLGFNGDTAVLNNGVTLNVGDIYNMSTEDFSSGAITAICSVAGGSLAIQEFS